MKLEEFAKSTTEKKIIEDKDLHDMNFNEVSWLVFHLLKQTKYTTKSLTLELRK